MIQQKTKYTFFMLRVSSGHGHSGSIFQLSPCLYLTYILAESARKTPTSVIFSEARMNNAATSELLNPSAAQNQIRPVLWPMKSSGLFFASRSASQAHPNWVHLHQCQLSAPLTRHSKYIQCIWVKDQASRHAAIDIAKRCDLQYPGVYHAPGVRNCDGFRYFYDSSRMFSFGLLLNSLFWPVDKNIVGMEWNVRVRSSRTTNLIRLMTDY